MGIRSFQSYPAPQNFRDKLINHVYGRTEVALAASAAARARIDSPQAHRAYADAMREKLEQAIGGIPYDPSLPLDARITGVLDEPHFTIEKIIFQARPQVYVTALFYLPKRRKEKTGAVLFQCGHSAEGKACLQYQRVARAIASAGLAVLVQDPVGQGERLSYIEPGLSQPLVRPAVGDHHMAGIQCLLAGDAPVRYFIADARRSVDYLLTRPEVDPARIGLTGSSGGGTMTCNMMVFEPRAAAAAPGTFVMTRQSWLHTGGPQDAEQLWPGGPGFAFDHHDVLLNFAPKPLLILADDADFFPIEGTLTVMDECRPFWGLYGAADALEICIDHSEHAYTDVLAAAAARFFARTLNGEEREALPEAVLSLPPEQMNVTPSGQVARDYPNAKFLFHENAQRLENAAPGDFAAFLRYKADFERKPGPLHVREYRPLSDCGLEATPYFWYSQPQMPNFAFLIREAVRRDERLPVTLCLLEQGTDGLADNVRGLREICGRGGAAFVVDLAGMGKCAPYPLSHGYDIYDSLGTAERLAFDLLFIGDSLCALRLFELERTLEVLGTLPGCGDVSVYGQGRAGILVKMLQALHPELPCRTVDTPSLRQIALSKYYDNYDLGGYLLPGAARYDI